MTEKLVDAVVSASLIEGTNDSNNVIDTSAVTANADGSLIERVEALKAQLEITPQVASKVYTFATATTGAVGSYTLFTVTGCVKIKLYAVCLTSVVPAVGGATIEVGTPASTAGLIAQATAADLIAGELWDDDTPTTKIEPDSAIPEVIIGDGADITLKITTQAVASGVIEFRVEYVPISSNGALVAA